MADDNLAHNMGCMAFLIYFLKCILEILTLSAQSCDKDVGSVTPDVLARQH